MGSGANWVTRLWKKWKLTPFTDRRLFRIYPDLMTECNVIMNDLIARIIGHVRQAFSRCRIIMCVFAEFGPIPALPAARYQREAWISSVARCPTTPVEDRDINYLRTHVQKYNYVYRLTDPRWLRFVFRRNIYKSCRLFKSISVKFCMIDLILGNQK